MGLGHRALLRVVGSHDTASAVVAVPAEDTAFAFLSAGTWSLVGVEVERPVLDETARKAGFTNEQGVDGTVRFIRNVMGLWLLQESLRTWERQGLSVTLASLLEAAADLPPAHWLFEPDSRSLMEPGDMPARVQAACRACDQPVPTSPAEVVRSVVDSLALAHRRAIRQAAVLSDREVEVVHLVGGGARNQLLCQATADAAGLPVVTGPIEATAIGNLLVQARGLGLLGADLGSLRACVRRSFTLERYEPRDTTCWDRADERVKFPGDQVHGSATAPARSRPKNRCMPERPFTEQNKAVDGQPRADENKPENRKDTR
jgi:rhamnulokinase